MEVRRLLEGVHLLEGGGYFNVLMWILKGAVLIRGDIALLKFAKLSTLLIEKGSHKRYAMPTTLVVVSALWSFKIFILSYPDIKLVLVFSSYNYFISLITWLFLLVESVKPSTCDRIHSVKLLFLVFPVKMNNVCMVFDFSLVKLLHQNFYKIITSFLVFWFLSPEAFSWKFFYITIFFDFW